VLRYHGHQLEDAAVGGVHGKVPVEVGHGHGTNLPVEFEVVNDLARPFADLLTPWLVDLFLPVISIAIGSSGDGIK